MPDFAFLDWPFLDDSHRKLGRELEAWCTAELNAGHGEDVDAECRALVRKLGDAGWLRYCVPAAYGGVHERLDVRSLALIRETLARHLGLADFAFGWARARSACSGRRRRSKPTCLPWRRAAPSPLSR